MVKGRNESGGRNARGKKNLTARPKGASPTVNVTLRVPVTLKAEIEKISKEENRSMANAMLRLFYEALEARRKPKGKP